MLKTAFDTIDDRWTPIHLVNVHLMQSIRIDETLAALHGHRYALVLHVDRTRDVIMFDATVWFEAAADAINFRMNFPLHWHKHTRP